MRIPISKNSLLWIVISIAGFVAAGSLLLGLHILDPGDTPEEIAAKEYRLFAQECKDSYRYYGIISKECAEHFVIMNKEL